MPLLSPMFSPHHTRHQIPLSPCTPHSPSHCSLLQYLDTHTLSLSLTHSLSLLHTQTHSLSHTHTHTHTHSLSLSLFLTYTHTHSLSLSHTLSLSYTHKHTLSLSLSLFLTYTHTHSLSLSLSYTHTLSLSHTHIKMGRGHKIYTVHYTTTVVLAVSTVMYVVYTCCMYIPVLASEMLNLGVLHMLHSERLAQFTFPQLQTNMYTSHTHTHTHTLSLPPSPLPSPSVYDRLTLSTASLRQRRVLHCEQLPVCQSLPLSS